MYRIGEFSKLCGIPVPTLRYYDTLGLIAPAYTDNFTSYRYYDITNLRQIHTIISFKNAGFTLDEIKRFIDDKVDLISVITMRKRELESQSERIAMQLDILTEIKLKIESEERNMANVVIKNNSKTQIVSVRKIISDRSEIEQIKQELEKKHNIKGVLIIINYETDPFQISIDCEIGIEKSSKSTETNETIATLICDNDKLSDGYEQLLSYIGNYGYLIAGAFYEKYYGDIIELKVPVIKWEKRQNDDIDVPFVNDSDLLGKWQYVDTVPTEIQFNPAKIKNHGWKPFEILYFLPEGQQYWCYRWTKGYLIYQSGMNEKALYPYYYKDDYMFINMNSSLIVMKQLDNKSYDRSETRIYDDTDMPFVTDEAVIGKWKACNYVNSLDETDNLDHCDRYLYWCNVEFIGDGICNNLFSNGKKARLNWTAGFVLNHNDSTAESYTIKRINGCDYLFVQWKSGDYTFAQRQPCYYVFRREE